MLLFVDPGPLVADIPADILDPVLHPCDWWSCNQREATLLTGASDPTEAARLLLRRSGRASVIVRSGPSGCAPCPARRGRRGSGAGAHPLAVDPVDTTGAGDVHCGVFLAGLAAGAGA